LIHLAYVDEVHEELGHPSDGQSLRASVKKSLFEQENAEGCGSEELHALASAALLHLAYVDEVHEELENPSDGQSLRFC